MKFPKPWHRSGRGWYVTLDGRQISLGKKKAEAFRLYRQLIANPPKRNATSDSLAAIIDAYLEWCCKHRAPDTYHWYRYRLERFARTYPELTVAELRPYHVQQWIDGMDLASGSKRNYGRSIKRCMRWAKQQGHVDVNPIADLSLPAGGKREVTISDSEFDTLLELAPPALRDLLVVTWETGCRPQESLNVEARHVDLKNQRWVFSQSESKTDQLRIVYLTDEALRITRRLVDRHPDGLLFRNSRGTPWTTDAVNNAFTRIQITMGRRVLEQGRQHRDKRRKYVAVDDAAVEAAIRELTPVKRSGLAKTRAELVCEARRKLTYREAKRLAPKYSLYTLRHTWMNRLLTNGVDALTVAFLAGHADPGMLAKHYAHLSQNPAYMLEQAKRLAS